MRVSRIFRYVSGLQLISHRQHMDVEASLPDWQRAEGNDRRRAMLAATPALNPFGQIPGAAGNPLTRNAVLAACRWTAADGRSADVFAGSGLGARTLLAQLAALAQRTGHQAARPEHGGDLGHGVMLAGNVLVIVQHGVSAAVVLNKTVPQAADPVLERFAPILAGRLADTAAQKV